MKIQNTKSNRKLMLDAGYVIHDFHGTFNRKAWIIKSSDGEKVLYGVDQRSKLKTVDVIEFLGEAK